MNGHIPVMLRECIEGLNIKEDGIYVDGTLGGGGHSEEIVKRLKSGRLIAVDKDDFAHEYAGKRLNQYKDRITFVKDDYKNLPDILDKLGIDGADGVLLDIGVSSFQLDMGERGFSYNIDAPLDMRMDQSSALSAYDIVNTWSEQEIARIIKEYGEERFNKAIARNIVKARESSPIETTFQLNEILSYSMPASAKRDTHPSKRTFQAIRIAVNGELDGLKEAIKQIALSLNPEGRLCVITFHSLEDRAVKNAMNELATGCTCPPDLPICVCGNVGQVKVLTKKPIIPGDYEIEENRRSKSAKLRICQRI